MKNKQRTMNDEQRTHKAFTLVELLVAVGILAMVLSFASVIFRTSIESQRTAAANAEIMRKLRAITDQLNADFQGLCKNGEIFVVWAAHAKKDTDPTDPDSYERFDRIMFYANGDFQSYGVNHEIIPGNTARICYTLANRPPKNPGGDPNKPETQKPEKRILARTQHIPTTDTDLDSYPDPNAFESSNDGEWFYWNNRLEYDNMSLNQWLTILPQDKVNALSVSTDVGVTIDVNGVLTEPNVAREFWGAQVEPAEANSVHMLLCEGVGEFKIQGWSWDNVHGRWRWVPEVDPNGLGDLTDDTDFFLDGDRIDPCEVPGVLYPYRPPPLDYGRVSIRTFSYDPNFLNEANFNSIPGLGRALKFTFTLYDSKGVIRNGRTFTYIVYLDN